MTNLKRSQLLTAASAAILAAGAISSSVAFAGTSPAAPKSEGTAQFGTQGGVAASFLANARTVPHWSFSFTDPTNGVTYPITMVGSDPRAGGATTVHTVIIPLKMNFVAAGQNTSAWNDAGFVGYRATPVTHTFDGSAQVSNVLNSPVYTSSSYPADLGSDTGQLGDVFMRAQFGKIGSGYHVSLVNDAVLPTQTLDVPGSMGIAFVRPVPAWRAAHAAQYGYTDHLSDLTGTADVNWFSTQLQSLMGSLQIDARTLPIFLTDNVLLYIGHTNYTNCCILGYHGAGMPIGRGAGSANGQGGQPVQTFAYTAYATPGTYSGFLPDYLNPTRSSPSKTRGLSDIHALSHEISEWLDDPFVNNAVQPWKTPTAPQYGCTGVLEVGDPVVGVWFGLNGNPDPTANVQGKWHPEDEVFFKWFARGGEIPLGLDSWDGRFTFMGPRTTGIGGPYLGFGIHAQSC